MTRKTNTYARKRWLSDDDRCMDSISAARRHITRFKPAELERLLSPAQHALASARAGTCSFDDLVNLSTAMHKARAIDDAGIYRGLRGRIDAAELALHVIETRAMTSGTWCAPTLYGPEITMLDDLVWSYRVMLLEVTYAEFLRAERLAIARVATDGGQVIHVHKHDEVFTP